MHPKGKGDNKEVTQETGEDSRDQDEESEAQAPQRCCGCLCSTFTVQAGEHWEGCQGRLEVG